MGIARSKRNQPDSRASAGAGTGARAARKSPRPRASRPSRLITLKFTIASDPAELHDVQKRIIDEVHRKRFADDCVFGIRLALEEGLINAIKHGNKLDPRKLVHIEARITSRQAQIIIEDQGPGFVRSAVPDPTREENLYKCSGRGILLMEAYMDKVQWTRGGRRVRMIKRNETQPT